MDSEPGTVTFASLTSAGHFQFAGLFDGSVVSICAARETFGTTAQVLEAVTTVKAGMVVTPDSLAVWTSKGIGLETAAQALTDGLYDGLDADIPYRVVMLTTEDGLFKFLVRSEDVCDQAAVCLPL